MAAAVETQRALDLLYARKSAFYYLDRVVIDSKPEPKPFGISAESWQRELVAPKAAALDGVCGLAPYNGPRSFLTILARGHDKSSLEGRLLNFALKFSKRPIDAALVASDADQAKMIIRAMKDEARLNPHLTEGIEYNNYLVTGPMGQVSVIPADAGSAYGGRYNLIIADEVTHWKNNKVWSAIVSGRHKVPESLLVVISNAGFLGSWQDELIRKNAYSDRKNWVIFERPGTLATWMSPDDVAASRKALPPAEARRVLDNQWLDPAEETDYLTRAEAEMCIDPNWRGHQSRQRRYNYVIVVDYGRKKDRTALLVLHQDDGGLILVDRLDVWQGTETNQVQVDRVDRWLDEMMAIFQPVAVVMDEYQMEGSIQRQEHRDGGRWKGIIKRFKFRGGAGNMDMAHSLREAVANRKLRWGPGQGNLGESTIVDELAGLVTKFTNYGYRFDHILGQHDDRAAVLAMGVLEAIQHPPIGAAVDMRLPVAPATIQPGSNRPSSLIR